MKLTIDSWAWVELFEGTRTGELVRSRIEEAEVCLTPSIVLAELASFGRRGRLPDARVLENLSLVGSLARVIEIDPGLALAGAHALGELREHARKGGRPPPGLADALVLATARRFGAHVLTGDAHFRGLGETIWLGPVD